MSFPISLAEEEDRSASFPTSSATTANPRPCSPARAASIAALRASRLVWSAISPITPTMPPIRSLEAAIASIASTALPTASAPPAALPIESFAEPLTSWRVAETCSTLACIWLMLLPVCSTLAAWLWACSATCSTLAVSSSTLAAVSSSVEAWLCAPSASCRALEEIPSEEEATWTAVRPISSIIWLSLPLMPLNASPSSPISSRLRTSTARLRSPSAICLAASTRECTGLVIRRVRVRPIRMLMTAASAPISRITRRAEPLVVRAW